MYKDRHSRAIAQYAQRQHGVVSKEQALKCGFTPARIHLRVRAGEWERIRPRVYRLAASPKTWLQELMSACLSIPGSVASHSSAARLLRLDGIPSPAIEVITARRCHPVRGTVVLHRAKILPREDTMVIDGIPCTRVARTIVDLASFLPGRELEVALEDALRRRIVDLQAIQKRMHKLGSQGRCGMTALRRLLVEREAGSELTDSALEIRVLQALRNARLPEPKRQFRIRTADGEFIARVDFAYPEHGLVIEADGYRYHQGLKDWRNDRARLSRLAAHGWRVIHAHWQDVVDGANPDFIESVRTGLLSSSFSA